VADLRIALVTGATSGLGLEFAQLLAEQNAEGVTGSEGCEANSENIEVTRESNKGSAVGGGGSHADASAGTSGRLEFDELWLVARGQERLRAVKAQLEGKFLAVRTFAIDLSERRSIEQIASALEASGGKVALLVNNAGFAKFGAYNDLTAQESAVMIDLNVTALVQMCVTCLPHMAAGGRIINVASQAAFQPLPYMNIYAATKAFVRNYSRALGVEVAPRGISVTAICPGWMPTALFDRAEIGAKQSVTNFVGMTSARGVAKAALHASKRGRAMCVPGAFTKISHVAAKLLPQRAIMNIWLRQQHLK
jgi:hypothetical protein